MKDVADRAGVSLSTVSYVLSGSRPISEPTRVLILKAMEDLKFHPNAVARALASKRTRVIGLLLTPRDRGLGLSDLEFVKGAAEAARSLDHHLVLLTEGMDSESELSYLKAQGLLDGVILMEVHLDDARVAWLQRLGLPFSILGRPDPSVNLSFADIDFEQTVKDILEHLRGLGHQRIAFINQSRKAFDSGYGPAVRMQDAWNRQGSDAARALVSVFCGATPRDGWNACQNLFSVPEPPTALVVMNERGLPGVLQVLAALKLRVPEDVSVVAAVSSAPAAEMMIPALTSADAPSLQLVRLAVSNLVKTIEDPKVALENVLLPCRLSVRASTCPPLPFDSSRKEP